MTFISQKAVEKALRGHQKNNRILEEFKLDQYLFDEQLKFVQDPSANKVAVCSRRSGKTVACAADLVHTALSNRDVVCLYITLSRNNAKKIIWKEIKQLNTKFGLKGIPNLTELSYTFPNGSVIYLSGAKDKNEIEKFRGLALKLVYIDEAQAFREYINELIDDILSPALMDYSGTLVLIGTPRPVPSGFFHDCSLSTSNWSRHNWNFFNNPFITRKSGLTHEQMLNRELIRRGVSTDDPSIQREWFGKWILDRSSLLIQYNPDINDYDDSSRDLNPNLTWSYIMGIDLGFDDADAIAILGYNEQSPKTFLIDEKVVRQQGLTELVNQIQYFQDKYQISKMVIDQGGLGKKIAEEIRKRYAIPVQAADKTRKIENIAFLNDSLRTGRFLAKKESKFAQDTYLVEIDRDKTTTDRLKVSDKYHSDIIDAVLYAFKESPAYAYQVQDEKPKIGSLEWAQEQETEMFEKALEYFMIQEQQFKEFG